MTDQTSGNEAITLDVVDPGTGVIQRVPLEFNESSGKCVVRLELTPGAKSIQVVARNESGVVASIEIAARMGEQIEVELSRSASGEIRAFSKKRFFILPDEPPPQPHLLKPSVSGELDLVVLVDGTCLHPNDSSDLSYLLAPELAEVWKGVTDRIVDFVGRVSSHYTNVWTMVMAFGDEPMDLLSNPFLKPEYLLFPEANKRQLTEFSAAQLAQQLRSIPYTPGGDFIDGLADGLIAASEAPWRTGSRKLLLVFGQSPGFSVLEAEDNMTNLIVRKTCMEDGVSALSAVGAEIMTIFHEPVSAEERYKTSAPKILRQVREQYVNLASLPDWSSVSPDFDVEKLAKLWLAPPAVLAGGSSPGIPCSARPPRSNGAL